VVAAKRGLVESRASGSRRAPDLRGAVLLTTALGLLTLGLIKGPDWGWASPGALGSFVAAAIALAGFVLSSRSHPAPLVEPALLRVRSFVAGNALTVIASVGFYAYLLTHVLFLHYVWGYSLLRTGLAVAPAALAATVVAGVLGRVADRRGHRMIVVVGALIWAGSLVWYLERVGPHADFLGAWLPGQLLQGIGVGATLPVLGSAALAGLAAGGNYATASAVVSSLRQLGAVIGVSLLVVLIGTPSPSAAEEALRRGWVLAAVCFVAVAIGAVFLGRTRHIPAAMVESRPVPARNVSAPRPVVAPIETLTWAGILTESVTASADRSPLSAGRDWSAPTGLPECVEKVEVEAGSYLFHEGDPADHLYFVRQGRLQVLREDNVIAEVGRGEVIGELGLLIDAPRSASIRAVRDSTLTGLTKAQFDQIADSGVLGTLVRDLATRLHQTPHPARPRPATSGAVVAVIGLDADAPVLMVATDLVIALSAYVAAIDPGRVDRYGLERAERAADKVVLHATSDDTGWQDFCLRVADRTVFVAGNPVPPSGMLPKRAVGADLVLAGPSAGREQRRIWEDLMMPRSVHAVHPARSVGDLLPLAARIAGRSIGLILGGGGARAFAHLGVLEELETAGIAVDRFAGTSVGAVIAALAASGLNAAAVDAYIYEYFVRTNPLRDYAFGRKGLVRGRRTLAALHEAYGGQLVEELPKEFRCVSVDLLSRRTVVHRQGLLADAVACSLRLPGLYPPHVYGGTLHVDGGVLDNLPVSALSNVEGPLIAVNVSLGGDTRPGAMTQHRACPRVPGVGATVVRTMTMAGDLAATAALARADVAIRPDTRGIGLLEFDQIDRAREAGRAATREALPQIIALLHR
jgi:NTE family protein